MKNHFTKTSVFRIVAAALCMFAVSGAGWAANDEDAEKGNTSVEDKAPLKQFVVHLIGTRPDWPDDMTEKEERVMSEHFLYLQELTKKKICLVAGPCMGLRVGLVILETESKGQAAKIMEKDASVVAGVHTFEVYDFHLSLWAADYAAPGK